MKRKKATEKPKSRKNGNSVAVKGGSSYTSGEMEGAFIKLKPERKTLNCELDVDVMEFVDEVCELFNTEFDCFISKTKTVETLFRYCQARLQSGTSVRQLLGLDPEG